MSEKQPELARQDTNCQLKRPLDEEFSVVVVDNVKEYEPRKAFSMVNGNRHVIREHVGSSISTGISYRCPQDWKQST